MRKGKLIPFVILLSVLFNTGIAVWIGNNLDGVNWPFGELGPAVLQDSYYSRAPGLETVFGIIGDVPGGYSLYSGSPLQSTDTNMTTTFPHLVQPWPEFVHRVDVPVLVLSLLFMVMPLASIIMIGRRSYGSTKTR